MGLLGIYIFLVTQHMFIHIYNIGIAFQAYQITVIVLLSLTFIADVIRSEGGRWVANLRPRPTYDGRQYPSYSVRNCRLPASNLVLSLRTGSYIFDNASPGACNISETFFF